MSAPINLFPIQGSIAAGQSLSAEIDFGAGTLVGIAMPAAWTAASLTFQVSADGTTWNELYNASGTEVSVIAAAGQFIAIDPTQWRGINAIKVRSGTAASPVVQAALAALTFITKPLV